MGFLPRALYVWLVVFAVCVVLRVAFVTGGGNCPLLLSLHLDSGVFLVDFVDLDVDFSLGSFVDLRQIDCDVVLGSQVLLSKGLRHVIALDGFVVHFHEFLLDAEIVVGDDQNSDPISELLGKFLVLGGSFGTCLRLFDVSVG